MWEQTDGYCNLICPLSLEKAIYAFLYMFKTFRHYKLLINFLDIIPFDLTEGCVYHWASEEGWYVARKNLLSHRLKNMRKSVFCKSARRKTWFHVLQSPERTQTWKQRKQQENFKCSALEKIYLFTLTYNSGHRITNQNSGLGKRKKRYFAT